MIEWALSKKETSNFLPTLFSNDPSQTLDGQNRDWDGPKIGPCVSGMNLPKLDVS